MVRGSLIVGLFALVLAIIGTTIISPQVYAITCPFTATLSQSTIPQGTSSVTITGADGCIAIDSGITVSVFSGACPPSGSPLASGNFIIGPGPYSVSLTTSSLAPGSYCVKLVTPTVTFPAIPVLDPLTVTAPIPEYPLGLTLLAVVLIVSYSLIRRRAAPRKFD